MFDLLFKMLHVHTRWLISLFVFRFDLIVPLWAVVAVSQRCSRSSSNNNSNPRQMVNNHRQCQTTQALCEEKKKRAADLRLFAVDISPSNFLTWHVYSCWLSSIKLEAVAIPQIVNRI